MFAKLAAIVLSVGIVACVLLTVRQQRLQAVNELAVIQKRVAEHDRTLWHLRIEIAGKVSPANIEALARDLGPLKPLAKATPPAPAEPERITDPLNAPGGRPPIRSLAQPPATR